MMKTKIVPLTGDPLDNLYQLGIKEKDAFLKLEERVTRLLSTNLLLRHGQDILARARVLLRKKEESFFDRCVGSYAEGMGIDPVRYSSFLSLFEVAAHYGQVYPELKALLPGCTSLFKKDQEGITHTRLLDFPLTGIFDAAPRLYLWQGEGRPTLLTYSCEGLAPLFFQAVHECGASFALHHKPGLGYHRDGKSIFEIASDALFSCREFGEFKKVLRSAHSVTKWCFLLLNKNGQALVMDIDGPTYVHETYDLNESSPLIFTNIPLQKDMVGFDSYLRFSHDRQAWLKEKLKNAGSEHLLDLITDVEDQKNKKWLHPAATLSTVGAWHVNLTSGTVDVKEGEGVLVSSDALVRFSLEDQSKCELLKAASAPSAFEKAWKRAAQAQAFFDQGQYDEAYHELQMTRALVPSTLWKTILDFYLCVWDFKFIGNSKELALVYKKLRELRVPDTLKDQWLLLLMRFEKRLGLQLSVKSEELSPALRPFFEQERAASRPLFTTWMALLYPRLEILDVFSPHHK